MRLLQLQVLILVTRSLRVCGIDKGVLNFIAVSQPKAKEWVLPGRKKLATVANERDTPTPNV